MQPPLAPHREENTPQPPGVPLEAILGVCDVLLALLLCYLNVGIRSGSSLQALLSFIAPLYSTPREESFTILLRERNPLLFYSERGILYYSTPREESFTI